jgi:hypothetical protein
MSTNAGLSDNPDYWNALAASIWLHIMYDQRSSMSRVSPVLRSEPKIRATPSAGGKRLRGVVAIAIAKADAMLKKNPQNVGALYAKGISERDAAVSKPQPNVHI